MTPSTSTIDDPFVTPSTTVNPHQATKRSERALTHDQGCDQQRGHRHMSLDRAGLECNYTPAFYVSKYRSSSIGAALIIGGAVRGWPAIDAA